MVDYIDSEYAGDIDDHKSTSGNIFMMSSGAICWSSKKQPIVTLSTTEAEFVAVAACSCQAIWLRKMLEILNHKQPGTMVIYCDMSTIKLSKNPVLHGRGTSMFDFISCLICVKKTLLNSNFPEVMNKSQTYSQSP